jgi:phage shock protein C
MQDASGTSTPPQPSSSRRDHGGLIGGLVLITLGLLFLADNFLPDIRFGDYWPVLLIVIGAALLWRTKKSA